MNSTNKNVIPLRPPAETFRLAFAIHRYFEYGGLERWMRRLALACAELGHEVHVLTSEWDGQRPKELAIHLLPLSGNTNHGRSDEFAAAVQEYCSEKPFDCLIGFQKMPGLDVYRCGDPCLAEKLRLTRVPFVSLLPRYRTYLKLESSVFDDAGDAEVLVLSDREKQQYVRHYRHSGPRVHVLPAGVDRKRFEKNHHEAFAARSRIRAEFGISQDELLLLSVGSGFKVKGLDRSINAIASLPRNEARRTRLLVVGRGSPDAYDRQARHLGIADKVIFAGGREDVADFFYSADLLFHSARYETGGATILEAMVCGLPVLVTASCGYAEHIARADAGLVCPEPFSQLALNRLLAKAISQDSREAWKQNALAYCKNTDIYSMVDAMIRVVLSRAQRNRQAA